MSTKNALKVDESHASKGFLYIRSPKIGKNIAATGVNRYFLVVYSVHLKIKVIYDEQRFLMPDG